MTNLETDLSGIGLQRATVEQLQTELGRRLESAPTVDMSQLQLLESLTTRLRAKMNQRTDVATPREQAKQNEWVNILKEKGKGYLMGKIDTDWLNEAKGTHPIKGKKDGPFLETGEFNLNKKQIREIFNDLPAGAVGASVASAIYEWDSEDNKSTHHFIKGRSFKGNSKLGTALNLNPDSTWKPFLHLMWAHEAYTSSDRGRHTPIEFITLLPEPDASRFESDVEGNPDLLEVVFQGMYPGLTERGLQRVQTDKLKIIQAPDHYLNQSERLAFARKDFSTFPEKQYSHIVGEQPK